MMNLTCNNCGKKFSRSPSHIRHKRNFCSRKCYAIYKRKLKDVKKEELERLYLKRGLTLSTIAELYGCSLATIHHWFEKRKIPRRKATDYPNTYNELQRVNLPKEKIIELYHLQKLSTREVAKFFDVAQSTLIRYMRKHNIPRRENREARKYQRKWKSFKLKLSSTELYEIYWSQKNGTDEIAKKFRVSRYCVQKTLKRLKISVRKKGKHARYHAPWNKGKAFPQVAGENHYRWKGGWEPYYGPNWRYQRKKAWERDEYTCQGCRKTKDKNGRRPDVHHIIPFSNFGVRNYLEANKLENLITLCSSCHHKLEHFCRRKPFLLKSYDDALCFLSKSHIHIGVRNKNRERIEVKSGASKRIVAILEKAFLGEKD